MKLVVTTLVRLAGMRITMLRTGLTLILGMMISTLMGMMWREAIVLSFVLFYYFCEGVLEPFVKSIVIS